MNYRVSYFYVSILIFMWGLRNASKITKFPSHSTCVVTLFLFLCKLINFLTFFCSSYLAHLIIEYLEYFSYSHNLYVSSYLNLMYVKFMSISIWIKVFFNLSIICHIRVFDILVEIFWVENTSSRVLSFELYCILSLFFVFCIPSCEFIRNSNGWKNVYLWR